MFRYVLLLPALWAVAAVMAASNLLAFASIVQFGLAWWVSP